MFAKVLILKIYIPFYINNFYKFLIFILLIEDSSSVLNSISRFLNSMRIIITIIIRAKDKTRTIAIMAPADSPFKLFL